MGRYEMGADNTDVYFVQEKPAPKRIQRKRAKGWKMPPGTVYVGRPTKFGNPFRTADGIGIGHWFNDERGARQFVVDCFDAWLNGSDDGWSGIQAMQRRGLIQHLPALRGKDLACWCPLDQPCHADILLELANA